MQSNPKKNIQNERQIRVTEFLIKKIINVPEISKLVLFGSRARGDNVERSDFDIGVYAGNLSPSDWSRLVLDVAEKVPTLCGVDLVRVDHSLSLKLRNAIETEGVIIYERK